jgi:polygalacturonase
MTSTSPDSVSYPVHGYGLLGPLPAYVINIQDVPGADPTGNNDSTLAINAALASLPDAGGVLDLAPGTYRFSGNLVVKSNTVIQGSGALKAAPIGEWAASPYYGITNENNDASVITDENITVRGITIDYTDLPSADGSRHCIYIRKARRIIIENVTIIGGSSAIALLGCDDTTEIGNRLYGFSNCGSDHWDGPSNGKLIGCHIETNTAAQMVNFNPDPTIAPSTGYVADGFVMEGNTLID